MRKRMGACVAAMVIGLCIAGCKPPPGKAAPEYQFRTMQPKTAFDRAEAAMRAFGTGKPTVEKSPTGIGSIASEWARHEGGVYYRFEATIAPNEADGSVSVSLGLTALDCGMVGRSVGVGVGVKVTIGVLVGDGV